MKSFFIITLIVVLFAACYAVLPAHNAVAQKKKDKAVEQAEINELIKLIIDPKVRYKERRELKKDLAEFRAAIKNTFGILSIRWSNFFKSGTLTFIYYIAIMVCDIFIFGKT